MNTNINEEILHAIKENNVAVKKVNRLIIVIGVLILIFGLVFVFSVNNIDHNKKNLEIYKIENWVQNDSLFKKNVLDLFFKTVSELENAIELSKTDSVDNSSTPQNEINSDEIDPSN